MRQTAQMNLDEEEKYISRILDGDLSCYELFINKYQNMVYTLALRIVKNNHDAEEIAQDTFLKAYQNLSSYQSKSKFSTWIYRICVNLAISKTRGKKIFSNAIPTNEIENIEIEKEANALAQLEKKEQESIIKSIIDKLPEEAGVLLTLYYYEDLSVDEISKVLNLSVSNVKVKLFRARNRFKKILTTDHKNELNNLDVWRETNI